MPAIMDYKAPVVASAARRLGISVDKSAIRDISAEIEWAKVSMIGSEKYVDALDEQLREPPAGLDAETMSSLLKVYESAKDERGVIDFEDVLLLMTGILQDREDIARTVRSQYRILSWTSSRTSLPSSSPSYRSGWAAATISASSATSPRPFIPSRAQTRPTS